MPSISTLRSVLEVTGTLLDLRKGKKSFILPLYLKRVRTLLFQLKVLLVLSFFITMVLMWLLSVNQHTYQECMTWFVEQLKSRKKLYRSYFMQDGATPHTAISTKRMIQDIFGDRKVGKHFPISWPPYSPADFWLWSTLKRMIFIRRNQPYTSIRSLKKAITFALNKLTVVYKHNNNTIRLTIQHKAALTTCVYR